MSQTNSSVSYNGYGVHYDGVNIVLDAIAENLEIGDMLLFDVQEKDYKILKMSTYNADSFDEYDLSSDSINNGRYILSHSHWIETVKGKGIFVWHEPINSRVAQPNKYVVYGFDFTQDGSFNFKSYGYGALSTPTEITWSKGDDISTIWHELSTSIVGYTAYGNSYDTGEYPGIEGECLFLSIGGVNGNNISITNKTGGAANIQILDLSYNCWDNGIVLSRKHRVFAECYHSALDELGLNKSLGWLCNKRGTVTGSAGWDFDLMKAFAEEEGASSFASSGSDISYTNSLFPMSPAGFASCETGTASAQACFTRNNGDYDTYLNSLMIDENSMSGHVSLDLQDSTSSDRILSTATTEDFDTNSIPCYPQVHDAAQVGIPAIFGLSFCTGNFRPANLHEVCTVMKNKAKLIEVLPDFYTNLLPEVFINTGMYSYLFSGDGIIYQTPANRLGTSKNTISVIELQLKESVDIPKFRDIQFVSDDGSTVCLKATLDEESTGIIAQGFIYSDTSDEMTLWYASHVNGTFSGNILDGKITGLGYGEEFYYRAFAINQVGIGYSGIKKFTKSYAVPILNIWNPVEISNLVFTVKEQITDNGGLPIIKEGVCYSTHHNPTISDHVSVVGSPTDNYPQNTLTIDRFLEPITTYYVRAFARNNAGVGYSEEKSFRTGAVIPTVTLQIGHNASQQQQEQQARGTATGFVYTGRVTFNGGANVTRQGIVYGTSQNPIVDDANNTTIDASITYPSFNGTVSGLSTGTYYIRAFAINSAGTSYSTQLSTNIINDDVCTVNFRKLYTVEDEYSYFDEVDLSEFRPHGFTMHVYSGTDVMSNKVHKVNCIIDEHHWASTPAPTEVGLCWATSPSNIALDTPTAGSTHNNGKACTYNEIEAYDPDDGYHGAISLWEDDFYSFASSAALPELPYGATYYFKAYVINQNGISYSPEMFSYTVPSQQDLLPIVSVALVNKGATTAIIDSFITNPHWSSSTITKGICWGTSQSPTMAGNSIYGSTNQYRYNITNLLPETTYYVRGYAENEAGSSYSPNLMFRTGPLGLFTIDGSGHKVQFSQGNLYYTISTQEFSFFSSQLDTEESTGIISRFGWGASNYEHGANRWKPEYRDPGSMPSDPGVLTNDDYLAYHAWNFSLFEGPGNQNPGIVKGMADWGYNAITNGGNKENSWRTLTYQQWMYVLIGRKPSLHLTYFPFVYAKIAKSGGGYAYGIIILPDDWDYNYTLVYNQYIYSDLSGLNPNGSFPSIHYYDNTLTYAQWTTLEGLGCVFLPDYPARINGTSNYIESWSDMFNHGNHVFLTGYWSSSKAGTGTNVRADGMGFSAAKESGENRTPFLGTMRNSVAGGIDRYYCCLVRLVKDYHAQ